MSTPAVDATSPEPGLLYAPPAGEATGGWIALVTPGRLLAVPASAARQVIADHGDARDAAAVLEGFTRSGFSAAPPFVLIERGGDRLRVFVRGPVGVTVHTPAGDQHVDGTGVSTWTEQGFADASGFDVTTGPEAGEPWVPLREGAAFVGALRGMIATRSAEEPTLNVADVRGEAAATPAPAPSPASAAPAPSAPIPTTQATSTPDTAPTETLNPDAAGSDYGYLFGDTMFRRVGDAAVRPPEEADDHSDVQDDAREHDAADQTQTVLPAAGDHDGHTILTGDLKTLRAEAAAAASSSSTPAPTQLDSAGVPASAPAFLETAAGGRERLDRPLVIGRAPTTAGVTPGDARLLTIPGDQDISRNHLRVALEGGTVVVTDLHSRNGSQIVLPGKAPQQLRPGEPTAVITGTVIDLGGGITFVVRDGA